LIRNGADVKRALAAAGACDAARRFFAGLRDDDGIDAIFAAINGRMPPDWAYWCRRYLGPELARDHNLQLCQRAAADPEWAWNVEALVTDLSDAERAIVRAAWVPFYPARAEEFGV
jgi:hypothetical protein